MLDMKINFSEILRFSIVETCFRFSGEGGNYSHHSPLNTRLDKYLSYEYASNSSSFSLKTVSDIEVLKSLKKIKPKFTKGPDNCAAIFAGPLTIIFNMSLRTCTFPDTWKYSRFCFVSKKVNKIENYRPITIICNFAKTLRSPHIHHYSVMYKVNLYCITNMDLFLVDLLRLILQVSLNSFLKNWMQTNKLIPFTQIFLRRSIVWIMVFYWRN